MPEERDSQKRQEKEQLARLAFEAIEQLYPNISVTSEDFIKKLKQLERGLPVEDEFAMLVSWLGKCKLIHKLGQEQYPISSKILYQVPDFFAVFEYKGRDIPTLIEVKTTKDLLLSWSSKYMGKIRRYADLLNLPLLIAWKFCPLDDSNWAYWSLFDVNAFTKPREAYKITLKIASRESILGELAGDFFLDIKAGVGLHIQMELIRESEDWQKMRETGHFFGATRGFWTDGNGNEIKFDDVHLSPELLAVLECVPPLSESSREDTTSTITWSFTLSEDYLLPAHRMLPILLTEALTPEALGVENDEFRWRSILEKGHSIVPAREIANIAEQGVNHRIMNMIFHQIPETMPSFLNDKPGKEAL